MHVEFTLTSEDYVAYNAYATWTSEALRKQRAAGRAAATVMVFVILLLLFTVGSRSWVDGVVFAAAVAVVVWFLIPPVNHWQIRRTLSKLSTRDAFGPTGSARVAVDDAGVHEGVAGIATSVSWDVVARVEETAEHVFVFYGPINALLVPKRAAGASQLADAIRQRLGNARP